MTATPEIEASEGRVFAPAIADAGLLQGSELRTFTLINFPSKGEEASQVRVFLPIKQTADMDVSEARVFTVGSGRIATPKLRCWTFSLDDHDFYVIRLGDTYTLVYDLVTQTWMEWASPAPLPFWRVGTGFMWPGMGAITFANGAQTRVVCGDDTFGQLYTLNPEQGYDESPQSYQADLGFTRRVMGGVTVRARQTQPVGAVYLAVDLGNPQFPGASVSLRTSDDEGKTWDVQGSITVEPGNFDQEFSWRSLGLMKRPSKTFEITDNGAFSRIDALDMR